MSILDRIRGWFRLPESEDQVVECDSCGFKGTVGTDECPECGGDLEPVQSIPSYGYYGPMV